MSNEKKFTIRTNNCTFSWYEWVYIEIYKGWEKKRIVGVEDEMVDFIFDQKKVTLFSNNPCNSKIKPCWLDIGTCIVGSKMDVSKFMF